MVYTYIYICIVDVAQFVGRGTASLAWGRKQYIRCEGQRGSIASVAAGFSPRTGGHDVGKSWTTPARREVNELYHKQTRN